MTIVIDCFVFAVLVCILVGDNAPVSSRDNCHRLCRFPGVGVRFLLEMTRPFRVVTIVIDCFVFAVLVCVLVGANAPVPSRDNCHLLRRFPSIGVHACWRQRTIFES